MKAIITNIFEQIKKRLCERRNNRPVTVNRYAERERTELMVRKSGRAEDDGQVNGVSAVIYNTEIDVNNVENNTHNQIETDQQPISQPSVAHQLKQPTIKPSTYTIPTQASDIDIDPTSPQPLSSPHLRHQIIESQVLSAQHLEHLHQTYTQFKYLQQVDLKRKKHFWKRVYKNYNNEELGKDIEDLINEEGEERQETLDSGVLGRMYDQDIVAIRELKYSGQLNDYPDISYSCYTNIRTLWISAKRTPNLLIKKMTLKILQKLTARSFSTLSFGRWLNDEIINSYLQMIDTKAFEIGKEYKVLNSFFAQTTFSKSPEMITRALKRKSITRFNKIVVAINGGAHWYFALINNGRISIFDSISKPIQHYQQSDTSSAIFQNIKDFADWFYQKEHTLEVVQEYPQQENSYDCGMFLLCGIKDVVRDVEEWTFGQGDIGYKRVQVAKELLDERIDGFREG